VIRPQLNAVSGPPAGDGEVHRYSTTPSADLLAIVRVCSRHPTLLGDTVMTGLRFGEPAPDFTLPSTAGTDVTLSALRGQDVALVFYCYDWGRI